MQKIVVVNYYDENEDEYAHIVGSRANRTKNYEYLAPSGAMGTETYAVVRPSQSAPSKSSKSHGMKIVKIIEWRELSDQVYDGDLKPVVAVFDTVEFDAHQERFRKRKALEARIENKVAELGKIAQLRILAETDPDAAALLKLYESL